MTEGGLDPRLLARFVRQRGELGGGTWILDRLSAGEALRLATAAKGDRDRPTTTGSASPLPGRDARGIPDAQGIPDEYDTLREAALACTRCRLAGERTQVVFSDGNPEGRVMVVGEAPGANEDRTGLPFVGRAGKLLDLLLASVGLSRRESVYICNVLKCRPPGNRNPRSDEIETCAPWLHGQIELVQPEVILAVGTFAGQLLTGKEMALGSLRGQVYSYRGTPLVVTYHPAALLRNAGWTRATWDDLQLLRQVLDGA
jgi:uracil-DNA glycosylase